MQNRKTAYHNTSLCLSVSCGIDARAKKCSATKICHFYQISFQDWRAAEQWVDIMAFHITFCSLWALKLISLSLASQAPELGWKEYVRAVKPRASDVAAYRNCDETFQNKENLDTTE